MVDFNNETTITRPAADVMKITVLQRRYEATDALAWYAGHLKAGTSMGKFPKLYDPIFKYFTESEQLLKNRLKKEDYERLRDDLQQAKDFDTIHEVYKAIEAQQYDVGLIKYDTGRRYDSTDVEEENDEKGL